MADLGLWTQLGSAKPRLQRVVSVLVAAIGRHLAQRLRLFLVNWHSIAFQIHHAQVLQLKQQQGETALSREAEEHALLI